jgi:hypothetical protein
MTTTNEQQHSYLFTENGIDFAAWYDDESVEVVVRKVDTGEERRHVSFTPLPSVFRFTAECLAMGMIDDGESSVRERVYR